MIDETHKTFDQRLYDATCEMRENLKENLAILSKYQTQEPLEWQSKTEAMLEML